MLGLARMQRSARGCSAQESLFHVARQLQERHGFQSEEFQAEDFQSQLSAFHGVSQFSCSVSSGAGSSSPSFSSSLFCGGSAAALEVGSMIVKHVIFVVVVVKVVALVLVVSASSLPASGDFGGVCFACCGGSGGVAGDDDLGGGVCAWSFAKYASGTGGGGNGIGNERFFFKIASGGGRGGGAGINFGCVAFSRSMHGMLPLPPLGPLGPLDVEPLDAPAAEAFMPRLSWSKLSPGYLSKMFSTRTFGGSSVSIACWTSEKACDA